MARGYGIANFGDAYYGVTKYVDAVAVVAASSSTTSAGQRIHQSGTQDPLPSSSATASANYICNASASDTAQALMTTDGVRVQFSLSSVSTASTVVANCERIKLGAPATIVSEVVIAPVGTIVTAGGSSNIAMTSSTAASGLVVKDGSISDSATSVVSSAGLVVKDGVASISTSASTTSVGERIHLAVIDGGLSSSTTASGNVTANTSSSIGSTSSVSPAGQRIQLSTGVVSSTSVVITIGREKWETLPYTNITWTNVA